MEDFSDLLKSLISKSNLVIGTPNNIDAIRQALSIEEAVPLTLEEGIEVLFNKRKANAIDIAQKLPDPPKYSIPAINSLYNEIRECMIFGLNGAAITLCGILVEFTLKYVTYKIEVGNLSKYDSDKWNEFESLDLAKAIGRASKAGLLSKQNKKQLNDFRERCRNPYSHYNIAKITDNSYFKDVTILNMVTNEVSVEDIAARDNPAMQAQAKPLVDAHDVFDVFGFTDSAVKTLLSQLYVKLGQGNGD